MNRKAISALALLLLGATTGCMPQEAQTPPDALEPKKMEKPAGMGDPKAMTPQDRDQMRKQMGR